VGRKLSYGSAAIAIIAIAIFLNNTSLLAEHRNGKPTPLAHRDIAQRFDETDLKKRYPARQSACFRRNMIF
jgi:glycerophosphoryl diester phosphodiesterase